MTLKGDPLGSPLFINGFMIMEEYKVIYPKPEINSREQRDEHDDKLEELLLEIQREQYRAWKQMRDKGIR